MENDNTTETYGLTLEQMRALGEKVKMKTLDYHDYNPDYETVPQPTLCLGEYLFDNGAEVGDVYNLINFFPGASERLNFGKIVDTDSQYQYGGYDFAEGTKFFVIQRLASGNLKKITLLWSGSEASFAKLQRPTGIISMSYNGTDWYWNTSSQILAAQDIVPLNPFALSFNDSAPRVMSSNAGQELLDSVGAGVNITGLAPTTIENPNSDLPAFILEKTVMPWDFEWRGTFKAIDEFNSGLDLTTAPDGTNVFVWARDEHGIPLVLNVTEDAADYEQFEIETPNGTIQAKPSKNNYLPLFKPSGLVIMSKENGEWTISHGGRDATVLPRTLTTSVMKTLTTDDYNYPADNPTKIALWLLDDGVYYVPGGLEARTNTNDAMPNRGGIVVVRNEAPWTNVTRLQASDSSNNIGSYALTTVLVNKTTGVGTEKHVLMTGDSVNNLTSTETRVPLAAAQGKVLNDKITAIGAGTRRASSTGWNTSAPLDYYEEADLRSGGSGARGTMFHVGKNVSDAYIYTGIGALPDTPDVPYWMTKSMDPNGTATGYPDSYRLAKFSEIPATFTTNEWNALWA